MNRVHAVSVETQAIGRALRLGQTRRVGVHYFLFAQSIEEDLFEAMQQTKFAKLQAVQAKVAAGDANSGATGAATGAAGAVANHVDPAVSDAAAAHLPAKKGPSAAERMRMREAESAARKKELQKHNKRKHEILSPPQQSSVQPSSVQPSSVQPSSAPLPTAVGAREQPTQRKRPRNVVAEIVGCSKLEASNMLRVCKGNIDETIQMLRA